MIPAGYMAKRVYTKPEWARASKKRHVFLATAPHVIDIYSVSNCISEEFADYIGCWKHNGYWFFDSPEIIREVAKQCSSPLDGAFLFYYEIYEKEFDGERWQSFKPEASFKTNVEVAPTKRFEGFDVVTFSGKTSPECSPLSCNNVAEKIRTNSHCLLDCFSEAESAINSGAFKNAEPGPYRIFAVYSVGWPEVHRTPKG
jgi:hypothetical protein